MLVQHWATLNILQHFLSAFRTPKIKRVEMEIQDGDLLTITVDSESGMSMSILKRGAVCSSAIKHCCCTGLHKKYQVSCVDEEHLVATFDRDTLPTSITADAFQLYKVLTSFQSALDEVTLLARPEGNGNMQPIQLVSYVPPAKRAALPAPLHHDLSRIVRVRLLKLLCLLNSAAALS